MCAWAKSNHCLESMVLLHIKKGLNGRTPENGKWISLWGPRYLNNWLTTLYCHCRIIHCKQINDLVTESCNGSCNPMNLVTDLVTLCPACPQLWMTGRRPASLRLWCAASSRQPQEILLLGEDITGRWVVLTQEYYSFIRGKVDQLSIFYYFFNVHLDYLLATFLYYA